MMGPGPGELGFVATLMDSIDTATAPPRVLAASFVSSRHAAMAALLMAQLLLHPRRPEAAYLQIADYSEALVDLAEVREVPRCHAY